MSGKSEQVFFKLFEGNRSGMYGTGATIYALAKKFAGAKK
jgi:hypothetical protein